MVNRSTTEVWFYERPRACRNNIIRQANLLHELQKLNGKRTMKATLGERIAPPGPGENFRASLVNYVCTQALPVDKLGHQPRLYSLTKLVGQGLAYDDDVLFAAAWLHDLGVFVGHRPEDLLELAAWDNVRYAMEQAPAVLQACGFPTTKVADVVDAIRTHQPHCEPSTMEGAILREADILEQLGAIGILRVVAKVGRDTRYQTFTAAAATLRKALEELPPKLKFDTAKVLAQPKVVLLREFLASLEQEAQDALY